MQRLLALSLCLTSCVGIFSTTTGVLPLPGVSHPSIASAQSFTQRIQNLFRRQRPEGSASARTRGGAVRGSCPYGGGADLVALAPESLPATIAAGNASPTATPQGDVDSLGETSLAHPTLLFYLPFGRSEGVSTAQFMLLKADRSYFLEAPILFELPEAGGVARLQLPESMPPLEVGEKYNWSFSIICDEFEPSNNPTVYGWIMRVDASSNLATWIDTVGADRQYVAYLENGVWFDTVAALADSRTQYPTEWGEVLSLYGLEEQTETPVTTLEPVPDTADN